MIIYDWLDKDRIAFITSSMSEESKQARQVVNENIEAILRDRDKVAEFMQLAFPDSDIIVLSRLYHVIFNKNGSIYTFDIYPQKMNDCVMFLAWRPLTLDTQLEMSPKGRDLLRSQFNWKM